MDHPPIHHDSTNGVLDQDIGCPGCGYNLRGLGSDIVACPECGQQNDVALLLVRRWDKPWYRAPQYSQLCMPAGSAFLAFMGWVLSVALIQTFDSRFSYITTAAMWLAIGVLAWSAAIAWVWNKLDGQISAGFALLVHLSIIGYIGGLVFFLMGSISLVAAIVNFNDSYYNSDLLSFVIYIAMFLGGIGAFFGARWIERIAAKHCIRLYLRRPTTSG